MVLVLLRPSLHYMPKASRIPLDAFGILWTPLVSGWLRDNRQAFCNHSGTFGNPSGSIRLLRECFGIFSATFRRPLIKQWVELCSASIRHVFRMYSACIRRMDAERLQNKCRNVPEVAEWIPNGYRTSRMVAEGLPKPSRNLFEYSFGKPSASKY